MLAPMRPEDIRAFVQRDWDAIAAAKREAWIEAHRRLGADGALAQADGLRLHVRLLRPDWPTQQERQEDLAVHARVAEALRRVGNARRR
jgi:hypothetical protein